MQCKTIPSQENSSRRSGSAWCGRKRAPPPSRNTCGMRRILPPGWTAGRRPRRRRGPGRPPCWRRSWRRPPSAFRVKPLRIQRRLFRDDSRELTRPEYLRLLETARTQGRERLALLLETICGTGIRVSEVRYVTVEAVYRGRAEISLKGKIRTILLPGKLCRKLLKYARKQKIASGEIFLTRNEKGISRRQIWAEMKALCDKAGVAPSKVFPHNLRHLFARTFYRVCRDVAKLADVLGHSSIETTRIYLISTGTEHAGTLARLGLVC